MNELSEYWWLSFVLLATWALVGYIILMVLRERKRRCEERERKQREMEEELGLNEGESVADLEKKFGQRGK